MEIKIKGKLNRTWIRGKNFDIGKPSLWDEAEISLTPPTPSEIAGLKEGDEILVKRKVRCINGKKTLIITDDNETDIVAIFPQPQQEYKFNLQSMDAKVWAEEFNKTLVKKGIQPFDPDFMLGWFANAIMVGFDEANRRNVKIEPKKEIEELIIPPRSFKDIYFVWREIINKLNEVIYYINKEA